MFGLAEFAERLTLALEVSIVVLVISEIRKWIELIRSCKDAD